MVERQDLEMAPVGWHTHLRQFMRREPLMLPLVMVFIGCFVLIPVFTMIWVEPTTASQLKLVEAIDIRMQSIG